MNRYPLLALYLPIKVLVWESEDDAVWRSYNSPRIPARATWAGYVPFGVLAKLVAAAAEQRK